VNTSRPGDKGGIADLLKVLDAHNRGFLFVTPEGVIIDATASALELLGRDRAAVIDRPLHRFSPNPEAIAPYLRACARTSHPVPGAIHVTTGDGKTKKINWSGARCELSIHEGPVVSLMIMPQREALERFFLLNQQLERLRTEVAQRLVVEGELLSERSLLQSAMQSLEEADRRKDVYLATLAHELRNPLAPIQNAVSIIRLADGDKEAYSEACRLLERQVGQLVRLIDDLLDVSRISTGKLVLQNRRIEIGAILQMAVETAMPAIESAGHEFSVRFPASGVKIDGDSARLAQVFGNLLNNAAKYTAPGGKISLFTEVEGDQVTVQVADNGRGIPVNMLDSVFDMFAQLEPGLERSRGGLGIGLHLARTLTELHGGSITARSDGPGTGSTFTVRLPRSRSSAETAPSQDPPTGRKPAGKRILIADDNPDGLQSLALLMKLAEHEVATATNGLDACEKARNFRPDLVLLDIGMPKLNGYEAAERILAETPGRKPLLIAITGRGQQEDKIKSLRAGFAAHLVKPVTLEQLSDILRRHA